MAREHYLYSLEHPYAFFCTQAYLHDISEYFKYYCSDNIDEIPKQEFLKEWDEASETAQMFDSLSESEWYSYTYDQIYELIGVVV